MDLISDKFSLWQQTVCIIGHLYMKLSKVLWKVRIQLKNIKSGDGGEGGDGEVKWLKYTGINKYLYIFGPVGPGREKPSLCVTFFYFRDRACMNI